MEHFLYLQAVQTLPLGNAANILNTASSLFPQASTITSSNKENAPKAPTTGNRRDPNTCASGKKNFLNIYFDKNLKTIQY